MDGPLDFENEDRLVNPPVATKKRKKVIGLDDLLSDFYKENSKRIDKEIKRAKARNSYDSDEDENGKEALLSKYVDDCQSQMNQMGGEEEIHEWGLSMFGNQKTPSLVLPELGNCCLVKSFVNNELNAVVDLPTDTGGTFLEGLLVNGWLMRLVWSCAHVEEMICKWTLDLLFYSSKEELRSSACEFWHSILLSNNEVDGCSIKIDRLPGYHEIRGALEIYGFRFNFLPNTELANTESEDQGPPQNIRAWIKFVAVCCQIRNKQPIFVASQAEQIVEVIIWLLLDRRLQCLSLLLHECLESAIGYFKEEEWFCSCKNIANSIASRVPRDVNCLRALECISGVNARSKHLRSVVANQMLRVSLDRKAATDEEILSSLISINFKDKDCDLFKTYVFLVLAENWLLSGSLVEEKPVLGEMWSVLLRNCSCQINSTDLRSYASKVRTKASYLLQGCSKNYQS